MTDGSLWRSMLMMKLLIDLTFAVWLAMQGTYEPPTGVVEPHSSPPVAGATLDP